jgi:hypothetical protein
MAQIDIASSAVQGLEDVIKSRMLAALVAGGLLFGLRSTHLALMMVG